MGDFTSLMRDYRTSVASRASLVRMSFSAGGSAYLTRRITEANDTVRKAEDALARRASKPAFFKW
jgi:hypothetical protein